MTLLIYGNTASTLLTLLQEKFTNNSTESKTITKYIGGKQKQDNYETVQEITRCIVAFEDGVTRNIAVQSAERTPTHGLTWLHWTRFPMVLMCFKIFLMSDSRSSLVEICHTQQSNSHANVNVKIRKQRQKQQPNNNSSNSTNKNATIT